MECGDNQTVNGGNDRVIALSLIRNSADDVHLIAEDVVLAGITAELGDIRSAVNAGHTVVKHVLVHDFENIDICLLIKINNEVHVCLDGRSALMGFLGEVQPEADRGLGGFFVAEYGVHALFSVHTVSPSNVDRFQLMREDAGIRCKP